MKPEDYIKQRLDDQINWYDKKSIVSQKWFKGLRIAEIFLSGSITLLIAIGLIMDDITKIVIAFIGFSLAIIAGILALYNFQENWIEYRTTCESLRHHKFRFLTKSEPYDKENAFQNLVNNIEALISKENTNWVEYIRSECKENKNGKEKNLHKL